MKTQKVIVFIIAILAANLLLGFGIGVAIRAASQSDMQMISRSIGSNSNSNSSSSTTPDNNTGSKVQKMVLTASASPKTKPGKDATLIVTAHTDNGTAVNAADIQVQTTNYNNHTDQINLRGITDKTGDFGVKVPIPDHAKTGQWLVVVTGNKAGFENDSISTGFAVSSFKGKDG